jgi:hypothetical protein
MSGETEESVSGWTVDTLKAYIERILAESDQRYQQRFDASEQAVNAALAAAEKAVGKAETAAEKRFDAVNEFRGQLSDQARDFMPRKEAELQLGALQERLVSVEKLGARDAGDRVGGDRIIGMLFGVAGLIVAVSTVIIAVVTH